MLEYWIFGRVDLKHRLAFHDSITPVFQHSILSNWSIIYESRM